MVKHQYCQYYYCSTVLSNDKRASNVFYACAVHDVSAKYVLYWCFIMPIFILSRDCYRSALIGWRYCVTSVNMELKTVKQNKQCMYVSTNKLLAVTL